MSILKQVNTVVWMAIIISFFIVSVSYAKPSSPDKTAIEEIKRDMREAAQTIKGYSAEQRDEAVDTVEDTLDKLDSRIEDMEDRLDDQSDKMDKAARKKARATLETLRKQRNKLSEWYGSLKHSSRDAWQEVKSGFVESYESIMDALDDAENEY